MKVVRQITYEGPEENIKEQLRLSLPVGTKVYGQVTMTISTVPSSPSTKLCVVCGESTPMPGRVTCTGCHGNNLHPYRG